MKNARVTAQKGCKPALAHLGAMVALAICSTSVAQVNLLTNGGFEIDNGFNAFGGTTDAFTTGFNFAGFQGWPGWATDFNDNGVRDGSYDTGTPGGFMFFNLFPNQTEGLADHPVLTGDASGIALGPFDGNTTSFAWQQLPVTPGDTVELTVWARTDSTALNPSGNPEPTIFESAKNQFVHQLHYIDPATGEPDIFLGNQQDIILDAATQSLPNVDQRWIESVLTTTVPAGASLLRQTIAFNQFNIDPGIVFFDTASIVNLSTGTPLRGDLDYDGVVDDDDARMLTLLLEGELVPASDDRFDIDRNQVVDQADLAALLSIPEPSAMALLIAGSMAFFGCRH